MKLKTLILMCSVILPFLSGASNYERDVIKTKTGKDITITFIKHASLMFEYEGKVIYVDPVLEYGDYSQMPKADFILFTHDHFDHFDKQAIKLLSKEGKSKSGHQLTEIFVSESMFKNLNMPCSSVGMGGSYEKGFDDGAIISFKTVAAYNTTEDRLKFHPKERTDNGYILSLGGVNIYIAGDTEFIPEMKELKNIDIAFLPVDQPYTMTVDQANDAIRAINPTIFYPYHYGETPIQELKDKLKDTKIEVRIRQMQ